MVSGELLNGPGAFQIRDETEAARVPSIWPSTFDIRPSTFGLRHSTFGIRHSTFGIRPSAFGIRHLAFGLPIWLLFWIDDRRVFEQASTRSARRTAVPVSERQDCQRTRTCDRSELLPGQQLPTRFFKRPIISVP